MFVGIQKVLKLREINIAIYNTALMNGSLLLCLCTEVVFWFFVVNICDIIAAVLELFLEILA